jgi:Fe-S-cluster containining protein
MPEGRATAAAAEWYAAGLRFECTQCGNCCTGPPGYVLFTEEEAEAMAVQLGVSLDAFYREYAHRVGGRWSLRERPADGGFDCVFLDRSRPGRAVCSIYKARPAQCRTWPFWPENLASPRAWREARRRTPCPGMDAGSLVPVERIRIQRDGTPR